MIKFFNGTKFNATGFKKQVLAVALCVSAGVAIVDVAHAAPSPNQNPPSLKANAPHVYVVKRGDTLWDISGRFLSKPWRWREIWASNRHVKNPHWIYPGDKLLLCTLNGRPLIGVDEGDGCEGIIRRHQGGGSIRPQVRVESIGNTIPVISGADIKPWLEHSIIISPESLVGVPYILGAADNRVITGAGQIVYARGNGLNVGQRYGVYRQAEPYLFVDANGKKYNAGQELTEVASAVAVAGENDVTTLELTDSYNAEVRNGDYVLPVYDASLPTIFYPTAKNEVLTGGKVVRVQGSIGTAAVHGVVTLDRGSQDGAKAGQVFSVYQQGELVRDPKTKETVKLPNQNVATVMIFKTFNRFSYAYVLDSALPIKVGAAIQTPAIAED
ncbi:MULTISPECIES: LysM peptidoglycan-binding domain-containing protein [unclassified Acinetobacter]|uniref:LysM peptidoglycan-binding domain-containing protein n=1 Tax=unclassified Acinetobacter TaxID=196816 RepID=UPI0025791104|nr:MULTISPECIES: LysM peptidoglycan-binding domain-containing protein [unclassified Acinetobacter]MDM1765478.1 LysM peptidoglycan-binding domain-containing protein [Acinetobacter sp. 226-1]MDM1769070.1 LysM peptidoglycan-binding domain-containing protein [Acinetobacter sp. 226-4]